MYEDYFEEILRDNSISFDRLDGSTTQKNISKITKKFDFNRSGSTSVLLISTKSASFALNLTSATRVIIMGMSFNPQDAEQAIGRAFRIGQKKTVYVYRLITYDTYESKMFAEGLHKLDLSKAIVDNSDQKKNQMRDELLRKYFLLPTSDVPLYIPPEGVDFEDEILEQVIARHKICNLQKSEDLFKVEEVQLSKEHIEECDREMKLMTVVDEE